jgi:hypothetical protein
MGSKLENDRQAAIADNALYEFETPTSDLERISSPIPPPDENGLFNTEGVLALARRRGIVECADAENVAKGVDNLVITLVLDPVRSDVGDVRLTAIAPGKWEPVAILEACGELNGLDNFNINYSVARPRNHDDLDEFKIARIVAAEGLNPYLSKSGNFLIDERGGYNFKPPVYNQFERIEHNIPDYMQPAQIGDPTWNFLSLLNCVSHCPLPSGHSRTSRWKRAVRALWDTGLLKVTLSPDCGLESATMAWTSLAYIRRYARKNITFPDAADNHAIDLIVNGFIPNPSTKSDRS